MEYVWAFLVGGALCAIGQALIDYTKLTPARILVSFVVAGVILSGVGLYPKLIELAGGGDRVHLAGFGRLLAEGVSKAEDELGCHLKTKKKHKAVDEHGFLGVFLGGLTSAAGGITAAMLFCLLAAVCFRSKDK